ncbi:hypothetical protein LCGC14_1440260 [marine sediment metagenome]|uniref:Uncharacterized protein n=1 Tax=marine sediment metagenome TaxID=412755 RepID=A0A0F9MMT9_9ZZZZ
MRKWEILIYYWRGTLLLATHRMVVELDKYPEATVQELSNGGFTYGKPPMSSCPHGTHVFVPRRAIFRIETSDITPQEEDDAVEAKE